MLLRNDSFSIDINEWGCLDKLFINEDKEGMNWVVDRQYIQAVGYPDQDKLFGIFSIKIDGKSYSNEGMTPQLQQSDNIAVFTYEFDGFAVGYTYNVNQEKALVWRIELINKRNAPLVVESFYVWMSLSYIMFKDTDVNRNITQSCAVFPSISEGYSKFANVRRSNKGPHLGIYETAGRAYSLGSYCRYENNFVKQVSPSLDGLIYHSLILAGQGLYPEQTPYESWIYPDIFSSSIEVAPAGSREWEYTLLPFESKEEFDLNGYRLGHPVMDYTPMTIAGGMFEASLRIPAGRMLTQLLLERADSRTDVTAHAVKQGEQRFEVRLKMDDPGEAKLKLVLDDGSADFVVFNVTEPLSDVIEARAAYLCEHSYDAEGVEGYKHAFRPVSNQGESLGKLSFLLLKNLIADRDLDQVHKAERSAVHYVKEKWFADGEFRRPVKLYGGFYRIFDLDYIGHIFYQLSRYEASELTLNSPETYLQWAAEIMIVRFDDRLHEDDREKKETKLTGTFTHFMKDLMDTLATSGLSALYEELLVLWKRFGEQLMEESVSYKGAITEHFYDNAGFGPTCEALCLSGAPEEARRYGELILANVGFSNDYRAQNPDRWWEALAYMTHSLWGGMVSYSALVAYETLREPSYLKAAYRSTVPIFFCYDWNVRSTEKRLGRGEAASTYCVSSPNMNKPSISHNRFGQSVFMEDEAEIFAGNATGDDWDMGEELAAYLMGFGTKTFLYYENGELKCQNGRVHMEDGQTIVTSYAAYPKQYYFFEQGQSLLAEGDELILQIKVDNGKLIRY